MQFLSRRGCLSLASFGHWAITNETTELETIKGGCVWMSRSSDLIYRACQSHHCKQDHCVIIPCCSSNASFCFSSLTSVSASSRFRFTFLFFTLCRSFIKLLTSECWSLCALIYSNHNRGSFRRANRSFWLESNNNGHVDT